MIVRAEKVFRYSVLALALALCLVEPAWAATFVVNSTADAVDAIPGDGTCSTAGGVCTLRAAIQEANALAGVDTITVPAGTYLLTIAGINEDAAATGDLDINDALTLSGAGATTTIVDGGGLDRVFQVRSFLQTVNISAITIRGGGGGALGAGILKNTFATLNITDSVITSNSGTDGAGVENSGGGTVTITNTTISNNVSTGFGGALNQNSSDTVQLINCTITGNTAFSGGGANNIGDGILTITGSTISGNTAQSRGGGLNNDTGDTIITNSMITGNTALGLGGGVNNDGNLVSITDSTVSGNTAQNGGGINNNFGTLTITRSTISGNIATGTSGGGGINNNSGNSHTITNSTISGNSAQNAAAAGGGLLESSGLIVLTNVTFSGNISVAAGSGIASVGPGPVTLRNTIVAGGVTPNCLTLGGGIITSGGNNVDNANSCGFAAAGDLPSTNPLLGPLQNNGGPTQTHALLAGSPAINAGNNALCPATDQRGNPRPVGPACDIGAFEAALLSADLDANKVDAADPVLAGSNISYSVNVQNLGPDPATGVVWVDTLPANVTFVSVTAPCVFNAGPGTVTCSFGNIAVGAFSPTITLVVATNAGSVPTVLNLSTVSGNEPDPVAINNTANETTTVNPAADLAVTVADAPDPVVAGGNVTYTVTVANSGPSAATAVVLTNTLPAAVTFVSATPSAGTCAAPAAGAFTCNLGTINSGANATVVVVVTTTGATAASITNSATATAAVADPSAANNTGAAATTVNPSANLSLTLADAPDPATQGGNITYTGTLGNAGPSNASSVVFTQAVPASTTFVSATASAGACTQAAGTITCSIGTVNSGAGATVTIVVTATATGTVNASATISSAVTDPVAANNTATAATTVNPSATANFALSGTPGAQTVFAGQAASYAVTVTPVGGSFTLPVALAASGLPAGATVLFAPAAVTPNAAAATSTLTVTTAFRAVGWFRTSPSRFPPWFLATLAFALALWSVGVGLQRAGWHYAQRLRTAALILLLALSAGVGTACGNGGFPLTNTAGTYTINITGTSGAIQRSTTVTLTVQ